MTKKRKAKKKSRWTKKRVRLAAILIEVGGVVTTSVGIGCELAYKAHWGWAVICAGSVAGTVGAMIYAKVRL